MSPLAFGFALKALTLKEREKRSVKKCGSGLFSRNFFGGAPAAVFRALAVAGVANVTDAAVS